MTSDVERTLRELVALRSTSEDDTGPIIEYVTGRLRKLGIEPRSYGSPARPAIVASSGMGGVLLSGHLDTVPHGVDWEFEDGEVIEGKMYGRGSCDMKGGCAAMLHAADNLASARVPFSLCFTTDEETTMDGAAAAAADPAFKSAKAIIVAEPTGFDIVIKEKGLLQLKLKTRGVPAHASMPEIGENAIGKMVALLAGTADLQKIPKDTLEKMTMCVNTIKGGTRVNVIPSDCEAEIDIRYPADMTQDSVKKLLQDRMGKTGYELEVLHQLDPVATDKDLPFVKTLKEILGKGARLCSVPYATEMVMFRKSNKAIVICGPGDPTVCHADNEHVPLAAIEKAARIYTEFCSRMAGKQ